MTQDETFRLCAAADLLEGQPIRVTVPDHEPLAVCRVDGKIYVFSDLCSHGMASLAEGDLEGMQIFCPFHGGAFDIATGEATEKPCTLPIRTYASREADGGVFLLLS